MRAPSVCPAIFAFDPDALYCSPRNEPMSLQMPLGQLMSDAEFERLIDPNPFAMGTSRQTHNVIADRLVVVKKIKDGYGGPNFPNYIEWFIWSSVSETDLADVFGRCFAISTTGRYLMMERLDDISTADVPLTPLLPDWVKDIKGLTVFGKNQQGVVKVRDYALVKIGDALAQAPRRRP